MASHAKDTLELEHDRGWQRGESICIIAMLYARTLGTSSIKKHGSTAASSPETLLMGCRAECNLFRGRAALARECPL